MVLRTWNEHEEINVLIFLLSCSADCWIGHPRSLVKNGITSYELVENDSDLVHDSEIFTDKKVAVCE